MCTAFCTSRGKNSCSLGIPSPLTVLSSSQTRLISEVSLLCKARVEEQVTYFGTALTCRVLGQVQTFTSMPGDSSPRVSGSWYGVELSFGVLRSKPPVWNTDSLQQVAQELTCLSFEHFQGQRWHNLSLQAVLGFDRLQGEKVFPSTQLGFLLSKLVLVAFSPTP